MAKKAYVVSSPEEAQGLYFSWEAVQNAIRGKKNIIQRGFNSIDEAENFYQENVLKATKVNEDVNSFEGWSAWIDGSYNSNNGLTGSGVVLVHNGILVEEISFLKLNLNGDRNISGEINAALRAIEEAVYRDIKEITIFHDLQHLGSWYRGEYKAKNENAINFVNEAKGLAAINKLKINFKKVNAHTGIKYNEKADLLAKKACGVK